MAKNQVHMPKVVGNYYRSLAEKYFYTINFTIVEVTKAAQLGLPVEQHLASDEVNARAKRLGDYSPPPFDYMGVKLSYQTMVTLVLCYSVIDGQYFTGLVTDFYNALAFRRNGYSTFSKHLHKLIEIGWIKVEYFPIREDEPMGSGNIIGRYTMPEIADDIVNRIAQIGYRL